MYKKAQYLLYCNKQEQQHSWSTVSKILDEKYLYKLSSGFWCIWNCSSPAAFVHFLSETYIKWKKLHQNCRNYISIDLYWVMSYTYNTPFYIVIFNFIIMKGSDLLGSLVPKIKNQLLQIRYQSSHYWRYTNLH